MNKERWMVLVAEVLRLVAAALAGAFGGAQV